MEKKDKQYISVGEVAKAYGVSPRSVNYWIKEGKITPAYMTLGGHARFPVSVLHDREWKRRSNG